MSVRLKSFPFVVLCAAAIDSCVTRAAFRHRPLELSLFTQALVLYSALALLAWIPARVFQRWTRRLARAGDERSARAADALAFALWLGAPIVVHARLDVYTEIYGGLQELRTPWPWLEVAGVVVSALLVQAFVPRAVSRLSRGAERALVLALALAALGAGTCLSFHEDEEPPRRASPAEAPDDRPNLLMLVWDTTRAKNLNVYGYARDTTPNLKKLAEESIVFDQARSASRYTLTSHLSMLTGDYPSHHGARLLHQEINPNATPPIAALLRKAGYRTGGFVGTGVLRADTGVSFAFERWDDQVDPPVCDTAAWGMVHDLQAVAAKLVPALDFHGNPHWIQDFQRPAHDVLASASEWIEHGDKRPWFCFINLYDVHWPYVPDGDSAAKWVEPYAGPLDGFFRYKHNPRDYQPNATDKRHLEELYDAEMFELDREVDRFLGSLHLADANTAVLMCADHGEAFGEGERYEHADVLECQVRVPLMVHLPSGKSHGERNSAPVSGVDVGPTLLKLAGLVPPSEMNGRDLLQQPLDLSRRILVEDRDTGDPGEVRLALYLGSWKFEQFGVGDKQKQWLFDLRTDENGLADVAADHPDLVQQLSGEMAKLRDTWHADDAPEHLNARVTNRAALNALGYMGNH